MHFERLGIGLRHELADVFVQAAQHVDFDVEQHHQIGGLSHARDDR
jgi:hypothetical protein